MTPSPAPVYLDMTQAELDAQYDQRTAVPHAADYTARWAARSAALRAARHHAVHAYGPDPDERLDLFAPLGAPAGYHLHIHGGAWRALSRRDASFAAAGLGGAGADGPSLAVAVADFSLAPAAPLGDIVGQVRRAFLWLRLRARQAAGGRPAPVSVSGHSSGAHLAACLLHRGWWQEAGVAAEDFAGVLLASGIFDLEPVRLSARNTYLHLDEAEARALSPLANMPDRLPPLGVFWGERELAEFRRQSRTYAEAARPSARAFEAAELAGLNHFDLYDAFGDPASPPCRFVHALSHAAAAHSQQGATGGRK